MFRLRSDLGVRIDRRSDRIWSTSVTALCMALFLTTYSTDLSAQWTYTQSEAPTTPAPNGLLSVQTPTTCSDGSQTLPSSGFLKGGTVVTIDTSVTNTGKCDSYLFGSYVSTDLHGVNLIWYFLQYPSGASSYDRFWGSSPYSLSYDSRTPGNGSGSKTEYGLYQMGQYQLGFQTNAMATSCNFATDSAVTWKPVNVVACSPKWLLAGNPAVNQHLPPTSISLYVPSDMWDVLAHDLSSPAIQAAADWNEQLAGTGVSVTVVNYDCGTGGNCIDLTTGDTGSGCAMNTRHPDLSTGNSTFHRRSPCPPTLHPDRRRDFAGHWHMSWAISLGWMSTTEASVHRWTLRRRRTRSWRR